PWSGCPAALHQGCQSHGASLTGEAPPGKRRSRPALQFCRAWALRGFSLPISILVARHAILLWIGRTAIAPAGIAVGNGQTLARSEVHTSELQSRDNLVCRL